MTEVLGSLLADDIPAMLEDDPAQAMHKSYFMAYDIAAFTDLEVFKERMDGILKTLRETPPAPGAERGTVRRQNKWDKRGAFKACNLDANRLRQFSDLPTSVRLDSFASPPVSSPVCRLAVRGTYPPA